MANNNMTCAVKTLSHFNINGIQLIPGKNPKQCIGIIYGGTRISTSSFNTADFAALFGQIECTGSMPATLSVAKQKVSEAWGRSQDNRDMHGEKQGMTYADNINFTIQLKGRKLSDVLNEYLNDGMNYKTWVESVIKWYTENEIIEDNEGNTISVVETDYNKGLAKAKHVVYNQLKTKQLYIVEGNVFSNYALTQLVKNWHGENDIPTNETNNQKIVYKAMERIAEGV